MFQNGQSGRSARRKSRPCSPSDDDWLESDLVNSLRVLFKNFIRHVITPNTLRDGHLKFLDLKLSKIRQCNDSST